MNRLNKNIFYSLLLFLGLQTSMLYPKGYEEDNTGQNTSFKRELDEKKTVYDQEIEKAKQQYNSASEKNIFDIQITEKQRKKNADKLLNDYKNHILFINEKDPHHKELRDNMCTYDKEFLNIMHDTMDKYNLAMEQYSLAREKNRLDIKITEEQRRHNLIKINEEQRSHNVIKITDDYRSKIFSLAAKYPNRNINTKAFTTSSMGLSVHLFKSVSSYMIKKYTGKIKNRMFKSLKNSIKRW